MVQRNALSKASVLIFCTLKHTNGAKSSASVAAASMVCRAALLNRFFI